MFFQRLLETWRVNPKTTYRNITRRSGLMSYWNGGECCVICRYAKRSQWRVTRVVIQNNDSAFIYISSRNSTVHVVTRLQAGRGTLQGRYFLFSKIILVDLEIRLVCTFKFYLVPSSRGVKQPVCKAYHSPPDSAEITNEQSYALTPTYAFMACTNKTTFI
jgi:hypothetical protein